MSQEVTRERPNIVMILADQLRHDCTGYSGAGLVRTPNIDRIAAEGLAFANAFTAIPVCCPARQSLLTGRRPEAFGALWNYDISLPVGSLGPLEFTFPRALRETGYRTAQVGKWHVSREHPPRAFGYDEHVGLEDYSAYRAGIDTETASKPDTAPSAHWSGGVDRVALEDTRTHWLAEQARRFIAIRASEPEPFLVSLDFGGPHLPYLPHPDYAGRYRPQYIAPWPSFTDELAGKPLIQLQQLCNWQVERYTWDDWAPIVVFTADHGDLCGAHRMVDKHYVMYDDVVRVPLAIRGPSVVRPGSISRRLVTNVLDLAPTVLELAGIQTDAELHGRSLCPLLADRSPDDWPDAVVSSYNGQQFGLFNQRMIRTSGWKYVWNPTDVDELYDLEHDPAELHNVIAEPGLEQMLDSLRVRLLDELVRCGDGLVKNDWLRGRLRPGRKLALRVGKPALGG